MPSPVWFQATVLLQTSLMQHPSWCPEKHSLTEGIRVSFLVLYISISLSLSPKRNKNLGLGLVFGDMSIVSLCSVDCGT
jgi:hypothetical protein